MLFDLIKLHISQIIDLTRELIASVHLAASVNMCYKITFIRPKMVAVYCSNKAEVCPFDNLWAIF